MDIEKLIKEARQGNFTVSTVLDNLVPGDEVRIELQSGNQMEGTVKFKNSKTLALDVPNFGFWACRVGMIAGVGIPIELTDEAKLGIFWFECKNCHLIFSANKPYLSSVQCENCEALWDDGNIRMLKDKPKDFVPLARKVDDSDIVIHPGCEVRMETKRLTPSAQASQGWKCGGCGVIEYSPNQPRCEDCKRLMAKWKQDTDKTADAGPVVFEDIEASNVPDEAEFEKTEEDLEPERAI